MRRGGQPVNFSAASSLLLLRQTFLLLPYDCSRGLRAGTDDPRRPVHCCSRLVVAPQTALFEFGMRAALRIPLRASNFDPAAVIRSASKPSLACHPGNFAPLSAVSRRLISSSVTTPPASCSKRFSGRIAESIPRATYATSTSPLSESAKPGQSDGKHSGSGQSRSKAIKYAVIGGTLVVVAVVFSDQVQHFYRAAARTGRVVGTLAVCINE